MTSELLDKDGSQYASGLYDLMEAINAKIGPGYDPSRGIDFQTDEFEAWSFWAHAECYVCDDAWDETEAPEHDCPLKEFNFYHYGTGLKVMWYKRIGRGTSANLDLPPREWYGALMECFDSLED